MSLTLTPKTTLPDVFSDWLRPNGISDKGLPDMKSNFIPARLGLNLPTVNIKETSKQYLLEVAAPGLQRKDFNIDVKNNYLTISAKKEEKEKSKSYSRKEYSFNSFSRSLFLPDNINDASIEAKYERGVLTIHVPKKKEIPVKAPHQIKVS
jgi:HSP20 family protein